VCSGRYWITFLGFLSIQGLIIRDWTLTHLMNHIQISPSPGNIGETFTAAKLAKQIGCRNICYRPAVTSHDKIGVYEIEFSEEDISLYKNEMELAQCMDDIPLTCMNIPTG